MESADYYKSKAEEMAKAIIHYGISGECEGDEDILYLANTLLPMADDFLEEIRDKSNDPSEQISFL